jgi:hypothetical protein
MAEHDYTRARLEAVVAELQRRLRISVTRCALEVLGQAVEQAPVEEGTLRQSGAIASGYPQDPWRPTVLIAFSTVYASRQHEETTWRHPKGGKAKYLSDPLYAYPLARNLAAEMRRFRP